MSEQEPEKTRWGLLVIGLAVAGGLAWFEWSSRQSDSTGVVEPVSSTRTTAAALGSQRDFMADLSKRGLATALNPVAKIPKTLLTDTIKRPLFTATRRQPVTPPPAAIQPPAPPPPPDPRVLKLIGVMVGKQGAVALVRLRGQRKSRPVRQGDIIAGWTIKEINARAMKVRKAKVEATIGVASGKARRGVGQRPANLSTSNNLNIPRNVNDPNVGATANPNLRTRLRRQQQDQDVNQPGFRPNLNQPRHNNQPGLNQPQNSNPNSER